MANDYLQNIRNRMQSQAKPYSTASTDRVLTRPPAVREVGTFTGARSGMAPAANPVVSVEKPKPPGKSLGGMFGQQDTAQNESAGRRILRSALTTGMATGGNPMAFAAGAVAEGGRMLWDRVAGGGRRAAEFAGTYGDRYAGTVPPINDRLPQPGMPRVPTRSYGVTPGSGAQPQPGGPAYTVPTYGPQGDGQGPMAGNPAFAGAEASGGTSNRPALNKPAMDQRRRTGKPGLSRNAIRTGRSLGMGNQIWGAAQDSRALEDMAIHSRLIPTQQ